MRYYGFHEWLRTVSYATGVDVETLTVSHVDHESAILALSAAGGCPVSDNDAIDTAEGCFRLLVNLTQLRPYRGNRGDRVAYESIKAYARNRGYALDLGSNALHLIEEFQDRDLDSSDVRRAIFRGLHATETPAPTRQLEGLRTTDVAFCRPVSDPNPIYEATTEAICNAVPPWLRRSGARVSEPQPAHRTTSTGSRQQLPRQLDDPKAGSTTTRELMTRSITRVARAQLVVIVNDGASVGIHVEREWALRLGIPVIEFALLKLTHPHQDGPNLVTTIRAYDRPVSEAISEFRQIVPERLWEIADAKAVAEATAIANEAPYAYLRATWSTLNRQEREAVSHAVRMSRPYIEGLLSSPAALELASKRQRGRLDRMLGVPAQRTAADQATLSEGQEDLLIEAAMGAGYAGRDLVRTVRTATEIMARTRKRGRLSSIDDAAAWIVEAAAVLRRNSDG